MTTYQTGVMWPIAGGIVQLAVPTGYPAHSRAVPFAISDDGSVILGSAVDADTNIAAPCRWDSAGTVCTVLLALSGIERAVACSSDASVIYGSDFGNTTVCRWTSGGTVGALMSPQGADTEAEFTDLPVAICSMDGSIAVGRSFPSSTPTAWTAGTPAALSGGADNVGGCSDNGLIVSGSIGGQPPVYWASGTQRTLASSGVDSYAIYGVNGAGTIIHGRDNNTGTNVWWDGLSSNVGPVYGTLHTSGNSPPLITAFANSKTNNVVVGTVDDSGTNKAAKWVAGTETVLPLLGDWTASSGVCVSGDGTVKGGQATNATNPIAVYWDASDAAFMLPENTTDLDPAERLSIMTGVSRDGSVFFGQAIYVEGAGPIIRASMADMFFSPTQGFVDFSVAANRRKFISADGCTVNPGANGTTPFGDVPPVFLTIPSLAGSANTFASNFGDGGSFVLSGGNLTFSATQPCCDTTTIVIPGDAEGVDDPQIMLSVSDDGGRTWSVLQKWRSMGKIGEYLKRLRWLKMGQFRQRIIKLEITDPVRRNIIGFYEDVTEGME